LRERVVNLDQRSAYERAAYLLCELFFRLRAVALTNGNSCILPTTQVELGDTIGLTIVHTNRMLQDLRWDGLVELRGKHLTILDLDALQEGALFSPSYLHLEHGGEATFWSDAQLLSWSIVGRGPSGPPDAPSMRTKANDRRPWTPHNRLQNGQARVCWNRLQRQPAHPRPEGPGKVRP